MPVAELVATPSDSIGNRSSLSYSIEDESNKFYVDSSLGFVYPYPSDKTTLKGLCGDACEFTALATDNGAVSEPLNVRILPVSSKQIIPLVVVDGDSETNPDAVVEGLNREHADYTVRQVLFQPASPSAKANEGMPTIYVTVLQKDGGFLNLDDVRYVPPGFRLRFLKFLISSVSSKTRSSPSAMRSK